jgi:hypothetical protein
MSARDPDDLLRDGGGEIGDLYRRLPRYEPPRRLDRAVLNEAARAVLSGKPPRRQRWIIGVGSAAGLVLAAGLAWRIGHEPTGQNAPVAPTAAPIVVPVQPIDESSRAKREAHARGEAAPAEESPRSEPPQAAGAVSNRQDQLKAVRKQRAESKPASPPMQNEAPPPAAAAVPTPKPFSASEQDLDQPKDVEKAGAASAGSAAQTPSAASADKRAATNVRGRASPTLPSSSIELQRDMQLAPPEWLAHVRDLMQQGRRQQATESLRLFVRTHPEHRVPADLRELLE